MHRDDILMKIDELESKYFNAVDNPAVPYNEVVSMREELVRLEDLLDDEDDDGFYHVDIDDGQPTEYDEWMSFDPDC